MFHECAMDKMIRNLYSHMLKEENPKEKISCELRGEIIKHLECERKGIGDSEYEKMRDTAFLIAAMSEENGFVKGFKYAYRLFAECAEK